MTLGASTELPAPLWLPFAILAGFAIIFPLFWCFVVLLNMISLRIGSPKITTISLALPSNVLNRMG